MERRKKKRKEVVSLPVLTVCLLQTHLVTNHCLALLAVKWLSLSVKYNESLCTIFIVSRSFRSLLPFLFQLSTFFKEKINTF